MKQKTKVSAKTKEVLKELGETANGQDAKIAAMSLLGGGVARTQCRYLFGKQHGMQCMWNIRESCQLKNWRNNLYLKGASKYCDRPYK